jgi:hypothetical protein
MGFKFIDADEPEEPEIFSSKDGEVERLYSREYYFDFNININ